MVSDRDPVNFHEFLELSVPDQALSSLGLFPPIDHFSADQTAFGLISLVQREVAFQADFAPLRHVVAGITHLAGAGLGPTAPITLPLPAVVAAVHLTVAVRDPTVAAHLCPGPGPVTLGAQVPLAFLASITAVTLHLAAVVATVYRAVAVGLSTVSARPPTLGHEPLDTADAHVNHVPSLHFPDVAVLADGMAADTVILGFGVPNARALQGEVVAVVHQACGIVPVATHVDVVIKVVDRHSHSHDTVDELLETHPPFFAAFTRLTSAAQPVHLELVGEVVTLTHGAVHDFLFVDSVHLRLVPYNHSFPFL